MASLTGNKIKDTFKSLLKILDNGNVDTTLQNITDGEGNNTALSLSSTEVEVAGDITADSFVVQGGTSSEYMLADGTTTTSGGDANYVHTQLSPSASWLVTHNLSKFSSVTVVDSANTVVVGDVTFNSINQLTITFSAPFSGKAYIN